MVTAAMKLKDTCYEEDRKKSLMTKNKIQDFPDGPVAKTLCFPAAGMGLIPGACGVGKNKIQRSLSPTLFFSLLARILTRCYVTGHRSSC